MEIAVQLTKLLTDGGPWAVAAIFLIGIVVLWRKLNAQQATIEDGLKSQNEQLLDQNKQLVELLEASTQASVNQTNSNGLVATRLEELTRRL